jgi:hypothetical protein
MSVSMLACSTGNLSSQEHSAAEHEPLNTPVTITLTSPNPVSPIAPVLEGSNSVEASGGSNVISGMVVAMGSGGVETDANALINETWSRGTANIGLGSQVRGTLHASSVKKASNAVIASTDTTPRFDPVSTLSWTVTYPSGSKSDVDVNFGHTQTISPGLYGTVEVDASATLNLSSGTYYLTTLNLEGQGTIRLNQANGPVIIYVNSVLILNGAFVVAGGGDASPPPEPNLLIGYLGNLSPLLVDSTFDGALVAPSVQVQLLSTAGVNKGFFAAKDLFLGINAKAQYRFPAAIVSAANPTGSACQQLLADAGIPLQSVPLYCHTCSSSDDTDHDGVPDCLDRCPYDPTKTAPGICGCNVPDTDSDNDGIPNCIEPGLSSLDPNNTTPGQCGVVGSIVAPANMPCSDTACPQSGATCNGAGVCGNPAACNPCPPNGVLLKKNGVAYWFCGGNLPTEIGADGGPEQAGGGAPVTEAQAQAACSAKGLTLARIGTPDENRLITSMLTGPIWLGANDLTTSGQWRWSAPNTNNGDILWVGGSTGTRQNNLFVNWGKGEPGSARCAAIGPDGHWFDTNCAETLPYVCTFRWPAPGLGPNAGNAGWPTGGGGGSQNPPVPMPGGGCVNEFDLDAGGLPNSLQELINEVQDARAGVAFYGVAAHRPRPGSTCPVEAPDAQPGEGLALVPDSGAGCWYTNAQPIHSDGSNGATPDGLPGDVDCMQDSDCTQAFDAGYVCRQLRDITSCQPPDGGGDADLGLDSGACIGHALCVQLVCPPVSGAACQEVQICAKDPDVDASPDPGTNLDAGTYDPSAMFGGALPDASPSPQYSDPPQFSGPDHTWCHMSPNDVIAANQPAQNVGGSSGQGSKIHFTFDPNLVFEVHANPRALGENFMDLHAAATLSAGVQLRGFLGQNYHADIIDIGAGMHATRCSVDNDETQFTILGFDVLPAIGIGIPKFNSAKRFPNETLACNDSLNRFTLWANRAKKAYRDAQQLLIQYKNAQDAGGRLQPSLCHDILATVSVDDIPFFPGGLRCPEGEPPELTINRFVEYLQAPGLGQISELRRAAQGLVEDTQHVLDSAIDQLQYDIKDIQRDESQTILNVPFAIGPVPMVLQIDVFATYGINGSFKPTFNIPLAQIGGLDDSNAAPPGDTTVTPASLARITVTVAPFASAGLSAFVGAGIDLGVFDASIGIEGRVTLGQVQAPIYAGAGLDMLVQSDPRPIPADIAPASVASLTNPLGSLFQFGVPKSFNYMVWFDYGAGIQLNNILSGEIDGKLHIEFFFFSLDWRVRIVKFNGWSKTYNLVSGGSGPNTSSNAGPAVGSSYFAATDASTTVVTTHGQGPSMGLSESQLPLTVLQSLTAPIGAAAGDAGVSGAAPPNVPIIPFDPTKIQTFFYDNQCCAREQQDCDPAGVPQCCPGFACALDDAGDRPGKCVVSCVQDGGTCQVGGPVGTGCCGALFCGSNSTCQSCVDFGQACDTSHPCCGAGLACAAGEAGPTTCCRVADQPCASDSECCGSLFCAQGFCHPFIR